MQAQARVGGNGLRGGAEVEDEESVRYRLMFRLSKPPHGGAKHAYEAWALEVPGVTRAWPKPLWMGLDTVDLFFVCDDQPVIIPDAYQVEQVRAHIEVQRPVMAELFVMAPVAWPVPLSIAVKPDTTAVRAEVEAELVDLFRREADATSGQTLVPECPKSETTSLAEHLYFRMTRKDENASRRLSDTGCVATPSSVKASFSGGVTQYRCVVGGDPGTWRASAWITGRGPSASRPHLGANDAGVIFLDNTHSVAGKPIWWNGSEWVDANGAVA